MPSSGDNVLAVSILHEMFNCEVDVPLANLLGVNAPIEVEETVGRAGMPPTPLPRVHGQHGHAGL